MEPKELFETHLDLINEICAAVCRRYCCYPPDSEDFTSQARLALMADDYDKLRQFKGRSQFATFLRSVITHLFLDSRNQAWGRWRPSAAAQRLGEPALQLDQLLHRDGYSLHEAIQILKINMGFEQSEVELRQLAEALPSRHRRYFTDISELESLPAPRGADADLIDRQKATAGRLAKEALQHALAAQEPMCRLLVKMRFGEGLAVTRIAQVLKLERRKLYSRFDKCRQSLRSFLESKGLNAQDVWELEGWMS